MRIALVVERFEPGAGGVENVAWQTAHGLADRGHDVTVIARQAPAATEVVVQRVRVPEFWQPLRVRAFSRAVGRAAAHGDFDVVYSLARTARQDVYRAGGGSHADYLAHRYDESGVRARRRSPQEAGPTQATRVR